MATPFSLGLFPALFFSPNPRNPSISLPFSKPSPYRCSILHCSSNAYDLPPPNPGSSLILPLVASAVFLIGFRARAFPELPSPALNIHTSEVRENTEDEEFRDAFEQWKSKTCALTVPLNIVALRGSVPPSWIKEFFQTQGKRLRFSSEYRASLEAIFSELAAASSKGGVEAKNAMAADLVSVGDSWLNLAIRDGLIEPMKDVEEQEWFKGLSDRWKVTC